MKMASAGKTVLNEMSPHKIEQLIKIYKDDFRGILNHLYDEFQRENYG